MFKKELLKKIKKIGFDSKNLYNDEEEEDNDEEEKNNGKEEKNKEKEKNKELNKILEDLTKNNNEQCMEILKNEKIIEQLNNKIMNLNNIKNNSN